MASVTPVSSHRAWVYFRAGCGSNTSFVRTGYAGRTTLRWEE